MAHLYYFTKTQHYMYIGTLTDMWNLCEMQIYVSEHDRHNHKEVCKRHTIKQFEYL